MHKQPIAPESKAGRLSRMRMIVAIVAAPLLLAGCEGQRAQGSGKPPKPGPPQTVILVPTGSGAGTTWKVQLNGQPALLDPKTATTKIAKGIGPTKFTVNIAGNPASIKFKAQDPLTVWAGDKSVPQQGIDTQIVGPVLTNQGLVFWSLNAGDPVKLSYAIHFDGNVPSVDPIIDNGGGNER